MNVRHVRDPGPPRGQCAFKEANRVRVHRVDVMLTNETAQKDLPPRDPQPVFPLPKGRLVKHPPAPRQKFYVDPETFGRFDHWTIGRKNHEWFNLSAVQAFQRCIKAKLCPASLGTVSEKKKVHSKLVCVNLCESTA